MCVYSTGEVGLFKIGTAYIVSMLHCTPGRVDVLISITWVCSVVPWTTTTVLPLTQGGFDYYCTAFYSRRV